MAIQPKQIIVQVADVEEDPDNARTTFDLAKLKALGASLKKGQKDDIDLRSPAGKAQVLVDGARRLRAAKLVGIKELRAKDWGDVDHATAIRLAATSVLEKEGLTPLEEARLYQRMIDAKMQKKEIVATYGVPFNTLQDRLGLLDLPEAIAERVGDARGSSGTVFGMGHAKALIPIAKHPKLLEAALRALDADKEGLPAAQDTTVHVVDTLHRAELIVNPWTALPFEARHDKQLVKELSGLPHVTLKSYHGQATDYVTDLEAFAKIKDAWTAKQKARQAKERAAEAKLEEKAKVDPAAAKAAKAREEAKRAIEQAAEPVLSRLKGRAVAANLQSAPRRAALVWESLAEWMGNGDWTQPEYAAHLLGIAQALKIDEAAVQSTFACWLVEDHKRGEPSKKAPSWFTGLPLERQYAFVAAVVVCDSLLYTHDGPSTKAALGQNMADLKAEAIKLAKDELAAKAKAEAAAHPKSSAVANNAAWQKEHPHYCVWNPVEHRFKTKGELEDHKSSCPAKLAHEDKKKPAGGGAAGKGPARTPPAPKAKAKPSKAVKAAKKPVEDPPGVAKARGKLAGKAAAAGKPEAQAAPVQAVLGVAEAPPAPAVEPETPVASTPVAEPLGA